MKFIYFCFLILLFPVFSLAENNTIPRNISIQKTPDEIIIDGIISESAWSNASIINDFWQHYPIDSIPAKKQTHIRITYDNSFIYISAICFEKNKRHPIVQSLIRDAEAGFWLSDGFSVIIDPLGTGKTGYLFGVNAGGGEIDATISQTGFTLVSDINWNKKWYSAVRNTDQGSVYEIAIPFSAMQLNKEDLSWGINFIRNDMENNSFDEWTSFASQYDKRDLRMLGTITFNDSIKNKYGRYSIVPSIMAKGIKDIENDKKPITNKKIGIDAKVSINANTTADLMILPDFTQVTVDKESLWFQDYEQSKAEQRQFFLENSDLFTSFGSSLYKQIYTRRIGILNSEYIPIWYGAKATANEKNFRWGIVNIQTDEYKNNPGKNYSIFAYNYQFKNKSEFRVLATNIQTNIKAKSSNIFNRTLGLEYKFIAFYDRLNNSVTVSRSINPNQKSNSYHFSYAAKYLSRHIKQNNLLNVAQDNFENQLGYYPRMYKINDAADSTIKVGLTEINNKLEYWMYLNGKIINNLFTYFQHNTYLLSNGKLDERFFILGMQINYKNSSFTSAFATYTNKNLMFPLEVIKKANLVPAGNYEGIMYEFIHKTNPRAILAYETDIQYGDYYLGKILKYYNALIFRLQPSVNIKLEYSIVRLMFPKDYGNITYKLFTGQSDIFLTKNHIFTILYQYNTQKSKIKCNARYQWHYSPMSDFYIVYGEDFDEFSNKPKTMFIAFKLNYWLSI